MREFSFKLILISSILVFSKGIYCAEEAIPENVLNVTQSSIDSPSETSVYPYHRFVTIGAIRAYQLLISPSKGTSCPMHPHCSLYAYRAFKRYSPLKAFLMTADRLHRCGHDLENYKTVEVDGFVKFLDPVYSFQTNSKSNMNTDIAPQLITFTNYTISASSLSESHNEVDRIYRFADMLRAEGNYPQAITEYRRLLLYFPDSDYRENVLIAIFNCYYKTQHYLEAAHWGRNILDRKLSSKIEKELKFSMGCAYFKLGNFSLARNYFSKVANADDSIHQDKSYLVQGLAFSNEERWEEARKSFACVAQDSKFSGIARQCEKLSQEGKRLNPKNPTIAGILAIVPGLGYLYDGYKKTALSSFIVNSVFIWGTVEAFRDDNKSLGTMLSVLSFGWYTGNIYGSVISAQRRNIKLKEDLLLRFDIGFDF